MTSRGFSGQSLNFQGTVGGSLEGTLIRGLDGKSISIGTSTGVDFGTDVLYIGYRSGFTNNGGANCTALGNNVLADGSGPIFDCVLIGEEAARFALSTPNSNVSLGNHTLNYVKTGHENAAIGDSSMRNVSSGSLNAALGAQSLAWCGEGSGNVALGAYSGQFQQDAVNSTFVGYQAGKGATSSNVGGEWNVAMGTRAGYSLERNRFNTLAGGECGFHTTSSSNTAFGFRSLFEQDQASTGGIIALGTEAARGISGRLTIAIGNGAAKRSSGSECILIGNQVGQSNVQDLLFQVEISSSDIERDPLLEGNLDTSNAPYLSTRGAIKVKQKAINVNSPEEDGVVLVHDTGQQGIVTWQMVVLEDGSCMLRQNGQPICVFQP